MCFFRSSIFANDLEFPKELFKIERNEQTISTIV